ncbi:hypothetical protein DIZ76_016807 [Coccidioides immitis]|nr:hypothetical protein DIZ76_016807 [Coccidioides immitis]
MSLFRSPVDISSSDEDSVSDKDEYNHDGNEHQLPHNEDSTGDRHERRERQPSFDEAITGSFEGVLEHRDPEHEIAGLDAEGHATMMTTALLEYYCLSKATEILNAQAGSHGRFTRESPEVQLLGRRLYAHKSRFLSANGVLAAGVDGDDWETTRKYYRESLDVLGLSALEGMDLNARDSLPSCTGKKSESRVVLGRGTTERSPQDRDDLGANKLPLGSENRPPAQRLLTSGTELALGDRLPTPLNFMQTPPVHPMGHIPFVNLPGVYQSYNPSILMSRYAAEFEEKSLIGKGSYGVVYKAKNYVDGQFYAVKKIPLSSKRVKQLQDRGIQELDHILREIRTLARLDHGNVVRYFGAWAEYSAAVQLPSEPARPVNRPLGLLSQGTVGEDESSHGVVFEDSSHGIVFEASSRDERAFEEAVSLSSSPEVQRGVRDTADSRKPRRSFVESYNGEDDGQVDEDEVESIGRRFSYDAKAQATISTSELETDIFTDGAGENMSIQVDRKAVGGKVSPITLHIQMSLHPLSLAKYLRTQSDESAGDSPRHCYRLMPSIRILLGILSGVEYLHAQGIVHRDLKPANVFLSLPSSQDVTPCLPCERDGKCATHYTIPRIGDFGLVADISPCNDGESNRTSIHTSPGPVGTEFYRPPACQCKHSTQGCRRNHFHASPPENSDSPPCCCPAKVAGKLQIDESLDVYALGVILFELLYKFDTRMERQMVLSDLTCSPNGFGWAKRASRTNMPERGVEPILPSDFMAKVDCSGTTVGCEDNAVAIPEKLARCITGMVELDHRRRWTCKDVKSCLEEILSLTEDNSGG